MRQSPNPKDSEKAERSARRRQFINAINDALSPFGVAINEIPATPQRIRAALRQAGKTEA